MIYQGHPSVRLSRVSDVARPLDVFDLRTFCTFAHSINSCSTSKLARLGRFDLSEEFARNQR
jgi:hypothetical protein